MESNGCGRLRPRAEGRASGRSADEVLNPVQEARRKLAEKANVVKFFSKNEVASTKLRQQCIVNPVQDRGVVPDEGTPNSYHVAKKEVKESSTIVKKATTGASKRKGSQLAIEDSGWRASAPERGGAYTRGSARNLGRATDDEAARRVVRERIHAKSSHSSNKSRKKWWLTRCLERSIPPTPVTVEHFELAAALLTKGKYRSGKAYLAMMKRLHVEDDHEWTAKHALAMRDLSRAIARGQGPAKQAGPLPLLRIAELPRAKLSRVRKAYWPAAGVDAAIISCAWLLREMESSTARRGDVVHKDGRGCGWIEWKLPVSKTDQKAEGTTRSLACACPSVLCPVAAMVRVLKWSDAVKAWPPRHPSMRPLIVRSDGHPMAKKDVTTFYRDITGLVGVTLLTFKDTQLESRALCAWRWRATANG